MTQRPLPSDFFFESAGSSNFLPDPSSLNTLSVGPTTIEVPDIAVSPAQGWGYAFRLDFVPEDENRLSLLIDGSLYEGGPSAEGGPLPEAQIFLPQLLIFGEARREGPDGSVFELDDQLFTSPIEAQEDSILRDAYGDGFSFYQIDFGTAELQAIYDDRSTVDSRYVIDFDSLDYVLYFEAQDVDLDPVALSDLINAGADVTGDLSAAAWDDTPERILITTGRPNGQRAENWGADWLDRRSLFDDPQPPADPEQDFKEARDAFTDDAGEPLEVSEILGELARVTPSKDATSLAADIPEASDYILGVAETTRDALQNTGNAIGIVSRFDDVVINRGTPEFRAFVSDVDVGDVARIGKAIRALEAVDIAAGFGTQIAAGVPVREALASSSGKFLASVISGRVGQVAGAAVVGGLGLAGGPAIVVGVGVGLAISVGFDALLNYSFSWKRSTNMTEAADLSGAHGLATALFDAPAEWSYDPDTGTGTFIDETDPELYEAIVSALEGTGTGGIEVVLDMATEQDVTGTAGDDTLEVLAQSGDIYGGAGNDDIQTLGRQVQVFAGDGEDSVSGGGGGATLQGAGGNDVLSAAAGANTINGGGGNDVLAGGLDSDSLSGGSGDDILIGDHFDFISGADTLNGGTGDDLLEGGGGADTFVFIPGDGADTIGDIALDYGDLTNSTVSGPDFVGGVDTVALTGFGLTDGAAALALVTDVSGVATFSDQGTTITFAGLTAADLAANDFQIL